MSEIETRNDFLVGTNGESISLGFPPLRLFSKAEALRLAAWLVVLADPLDREFPAVRKAIENT